MRTKVTLVLVFLNVALFFFIFKFERKWRVEIDNVEARRRVFGPEAADIRWLDVTNATNPESSFTLKRDGEVWKLSKPFDWPANPHAVSAIINGLKLLEHETSFDARDLGKNNNPTLADYGLDKPKVRLEFRSGENASAPVTKLDLGDITKVGNRLYLRTLADDRIHVVGRELYDSLTLPLAQLRTDALLTIQLVEAQALTVRAAGGSAPVTIRRDRANDARWQFETPIIAAASKFEVSVAVNELTALHAVNFSPAAPATLPAAAPALKITLEGNNRRETLFLGDPLGATAIPGGAATAPDVELYAQLEGRTALFTVAVPAKLLEKLRNAQDRLRERHVLDFDARAVTAITLAALNQPPLTLQRDPAAPPDSPWQIVRRAEGAAPAAASFPADLEAIKRLLTQLAGLRAKDVNGFVSDAPSAAQLETWGFNRPEREVTLTFAGTTPPLILQLGTDAARNVYACVGRAGPNSSVYAVPADVLRELPVAPRVWRDRVVSALPTAARITALKLTDLETGATLLDLALDAEGKPKSATAAAAEVATVIAQLRMLRAKSFVQDAFVERFVFAGEERTWRYRLDATVSLPGGAGGEQTQVKTLLLTVRGGGAQQLAGAKDADAVFELEQPFLDALWQLTPAGQRDPGAPK